MSKELNGKCQLKQNKLHFFHVNICMILFLLMVFGIGTFVSAAETEAKILDKYNDPTRPIYHVLSRKSHWHVADPSYMFFWKSRYHMFFLEGGYEHISSPDMVHWTWHPKTNFGGCSGTMFLNTDGVPTIVTANDGIAFYIPLDDNLNKWTVLTRLYDKSKSSIVTYKPGEPRDISVWDPDAWTEGETTYLVMGEHPLIPNANAALLKSTDMMNWEYIGYFMPQIELPGVTRSQDIKTNDDISCPNFFKIGNKWMLLCISHNHGCRYYLGDWKDEKFIPDFHGWMNWNKEGGENEYGHGRDVIRDGEIYPWEQNGHGGDVFAPESVLTPDGRRVMWAWLFAMREKRYGETWNEVISLPRELSLPEDGVLHIKPLRELQQLRYDGVLEKNISVQNGVPYRLKSISGDTIEIELNIKHGDAKRYGIRLLCDEKNRKGLDLFVEPGRKTIKLGSTTAPLELKPNEDIRLRIFVDRSVVEVFANDRQAVVKQHMYEPDDVGVCLISLGGGMEVSEIKCWKMKAAPIQ